MSDISANDDIPSGFRLRHILRGHTETINRITWSPDGRMLASSSRDFTIRLWDPVTGQVCQTLKGGLDHNIAWSPDGQTLASGAIASLTLWNRETGKPLRTLAIDSRWILSLLWSPDGRTLASVFKDHTIQLRDTETGKLLRSLTGHSDEIHTIAWSPDGQTLASGSDDYTIRLWNVESGALLNVFTGHTNTIHTIAWSPDGRTLASGSGDQTIRLWDPETGRQMAIFEGHTAAVFCISFSSDGHLLASKSLDGTVRLWHPHTWKMLAVLNDHLSYVWNKRDTGLAFQPNQSVLATFGEGNRTIRIWDLDLITLLGIVASTPSVYYTSAKVALVGDTGVGKTGLGLVLTNQQFVPTDSSHGRNVWFINNEETDLDDGRKEIHEQDVRQ